MSVRRLTQVQSDSFACFHATKAKADVSAILGSLDIVFGEVDR